MARQRYYDERDYEDGNDPNSADYDPDYDYVEEDDEDDDEARSFAYRWG